jgi:hypothetical protein
MKKKAIVFIAAEQKGFLASVSDLLSKEYGYDVTIIARDNVVKDIVNRNSSKSHNVIVLSDQKDVVSSDRVIEESVRIEKQYNITLSLLISEDRALGQGYLFNVDKVPDISRASWEHKEKLKEIVSYFLIHEKIIKSSELIIRIYPDKITNIIAKSIGAKSFSIQSVKFGDNRFWSDNDYFTSSKYIECIKKEVNSDSLNDVNQEYFPDIHGQNILQSIKFSYYDALKQALYIVYNDTKNHIRSMRKKNSYGLYGWVPSLFRKVSNKKYVDKISINIDHLKGFKIFYCPLHMEPEVGLLYVSPEFNNTMEMISMISKSLPADCMLVLKEQPESYAVRSKSYYKRLNKIGNVCWVKSDTSSIEMIKKSLCVATITGTAAVEAIHYKKPVLSFGAHQIINYLPTVEFVSNYAETKTAVNKIINKNIDDLDYIRSDKILTQVQLDCSFNLERYKETYKTSAPEIDMARYALDKLFETFYVK